MILSYQFGNPSETAHENAVLAEYGFSSGGILPEAISPVPDDIDSIDFEGGLRTVRGFSLTAFGSESIDQRLGIGDIGNRLLAGLQGTFYDRISGSAQIGPDGAVLSEPTMRPL
jgi:hypothetical protein